MVVPNCGWRRRIAASPPKSPPRLQLTDSVHCRQVECSVADPFPPIFNAPRCPTGMHHMGGCGEGDEYIRV